MCFFKRAHWQHLLLTMPARAGVGERGRSPSVAAAPSPRHCTVLLRLSCRGRADLARQASPNSYSQVGRCLAVLATAGGVSPGLVSQCWPQPAASRPAWFHCRSIATTSAPASSFVLCGLALAGQMRASSLPHNPCFSRCSCRAPTGGFTPTVAAEVAKLVVQHAAALVLVLCHTECVAVRNGLHKWMADMAKEQQAAVFGHPRYPQPADLLAASKARTSQVQLALLPGLLCLLQRMHQCLQGMTHSPL